MRTYVARPWQIRKRCPVADLFPPVPVDPMDFERARDFVG